MLGSLSKSSQKNEKITSGSPSNPQGGAETCVISKGASLEGQFNSKENVRLDGSIKGTIDCENRLVMGETGYINGTVKANEAVIMGKIDGDLVVKGSLVLKSTAHIKGNITAKLMSVEEGAVYNGECKIGSFTDSGKKA